MPASVVQSIEGRVAGREDQVIDRTVAPLWAGNTVVRIRDKERAWGRGTDKLQLIRDTWL